MTLRVGEVFAGYTVVGQLGGGGMGDVYLAQHPRLPRQDALKILKADISADEGFRQRFIREADSVAALSHPNIVTVFDRGEFDGKLWIATQYVDGTDAAQLLRDRYPAGMPAIEAATIAAAIGDALDYAHERGLLHRDVKPANILLSDPGRDGRRRVFLADFGIARPIGDPSGLTATNFTVGTVSYAAPEQLMGADIDGRADQYALAATAFHLLTGKPPFEDSNPIAVISKHLTQPPPQLGALRSDLSGLDHILATAMAKDPDQRYPDCADFTADLTHGASLNPVLPHAPTQAAVPAPVPSTPVPGPPSGATQSAASYAAERAVRDAGPRDDWADARHLASEEAAPPLAPGGRNRTSGDRRGLKLLLAGSAAALLVLVTLGTLGVFQRSDPPQSGPQSELPVPVDVGELVIGTKFDQPGLGLKNPDGTMSGFDVDVAKYVAKELGYDENQIIWKESPSSQREALIENDQVEYVVATYAITDRRKEKVDFAGPYLITGQGLLIAAANTDITGPDSLQNNKKLCSVTGSTPAQRIKDKYPGVQLQQYETYSACVEALKTGAVDAVTTDEVILAGYAAQYPGAFKLTGQTFSEERYGIGLKKGDTDLRAKINDALAKMEKDGAWKAAFDRNLGPAGVSAPAPPPIDRY